MEELHSTTDTPTVYITDLTFLRPNRPGGIRQLGTAFGSPRVENETYLQVNETSFYQLTIDYQNRTVQQTCKSIKMVRCQNSNRAVRNTVSYRIEFYDRMLTTSWYGKTLDATEVDSYLVEKSLRL